MADRATDAFYQRLGRAIKEARRRRKLTQAALASAVGLTRTSISNIEKGRQKILLHTFYDIAQAVAVEPAELLVEKGMPQGAGEVAMQLPRDLGQQERAFIEEAIGIKKRR